MLLTNLVPFHQLVHEISWTQESDIPMLMPAKFVCMYFQSQWKTVWILIRWLLQKPSDLDLQCFQKRINLGSTGQGLRYINVCFNSIYPKSLSYCLLAAYSYLPQNLALDSAVVKPLKEKVIYSYLLLLIHLV